MKFYTLFYLDEKEHLGWNIGGTFSEQMKVLIGNCQTLSKSLDGNITILTNNKEALLNILPPPYYKQ